MRRPTLDQVSDYQRDEYYRVRAALVRDLVCVSKLVDPVVTQNILPDDYVAGLAIGDVLDEDTINPLVWSTGATAAV